MKKFLIFFILVWSSWTVLGQTQNATAAPAPTPYSIIFRNANSQVWERTTYEVSPSGQVIPHMHHYTELASGLCYQQNGQWIDSQEQINIQPDGTASATNGQHQVYFPADIGNGVIKMVTPDGLTLQSQPVGLSYDDGTNIVMIAVLTNSVGQLISSNRVIYTNAFIGVDADLLYTYKKSGFEQDVIFRGQPPAPEQFGLNSDNTRLQLLTGFFNPPTPTQLVAPINPRDNLQDTTLTFGQTRMVHGRAFLAGTTRLASSPNQASVYKSWVVMDGRTFLIEELPFERIEPQLTTLPAPTAGAVSSASSMLRKMSASRLLPPMRLVAATTNTLRIAEASFNKTPGVVFDYMTIDSDETNFTFQGDTTYYVSDDYDLLGTTTFEGGTVIKLNNSGEIDIDTSGAIDCETAPYRPAIFTSVNDNSVGDSIDGSTGSPNWADVNSFLYFYCSYALVSNMRFCYANCSISGYESSLSFWNCQFVAAYQSLNLYDANVDAHNILVNAVDTDFSPFYLSYSGNFTAENVTCDGFTNMVQVDNPGSQTIALTNCLVTDGNLYSINGGPLTYSSVPFYQTVGGGNYYLTNNSPFRNAGTTNISQQLLADLAKKTTYPPIVFDATNFTVPTTFNPQAQRDNAGAPDIGYHYDPFDYILGGCDTDTNLTFTLGTDVGWFEDYGSDSGEPYAISLDDGATVSLNGTATLPCIFARYTMVQEDGNALATRGYIGGVMLNGSGATPYPQLSGNFTKFIVDADAGIGRDDWASGVFAFQNCELYNGNLTAYAMQNVYFTNSLFFRVFAAFYDQDYAISFNIENCTFYNGFLGAGRWSGQSGDATSFWQIENTSFDGTDFSWTDNYNGNANILFNYNAYNTNNLSWTNYPFPYTPDCGTNEVTGPNDLLVTNYNWQTNWFGNFYLPTNSPLIEKGSTNANYLGLYHFTTQTNQIVNGTNIVTIGYHYVATNTNGIPLDSNGDGIPDYLEDANGNGLDDSGEIGWNITNDLGLTVIITKPPNNSIIP